MGGMVSLWGANSLIRSVQRGTISIAAASASNTATITTVDMANSRLQFLGYSNNNAAAAPNASATRLALTNSTTITATRVTTGASDNVVAYQIIEYCPGVIRSVQRGTISLNPGPTATATITTVNSNTTALDYLGCSVDNALDTLFIRLALTNSTTVTGTSSNAANASTVSYQVVEFF
jgi:hypothetical protein